ncbi:MAG TPA: bifunctional phosphoribosylaminoimidazolecarboxamide formyltransferase/IMP cyclohydrolase [Caldisericia bacterium]|nr:bifunctional phosphoribosylaminoimidazolecarboxamide formyltransferase/IMP cyclohydrolase [Caldisericia bacterium]HPF49087.1 bifunctional phosphoribosylaminoimidazolecarboxamide formyltransferase/IMP cyclohydrolase [Caldisericia bacterium]HPI83049.1 bifunctional phosphoribosylaminoimidazolecarboxamide formyltransferase/IMP cyclohydrolase [Caldisericia bacterium]HPQ92276.1 bifunctional phosphoribosylaminoimidazolecarboxamide formyltransferase/IMP cyclohydrolase [Caldisericia bacterium]HRV7462
MSYVLISVYDKEGISDLARELIASGYKILSTGGTARHLRAKGFQITDVSSFTKSPEVLGGRVKTLHPKIFGGILARRNNPGDEKDLETLESDFIDIVVVNLYPFEETIARPDCTEDEAIEQIDIGGVALIRAAAKNFAHTVVLCKPSQFSEFVERLNNGRFDIEYKRKLAKEAFAVTNTYDKAIHKYLDSDGSTDCQKDEQFLPKTIVPEQIQELRYGENPHQKAGLYSFGMGELQINQLHGKKLSYNNLLDADAALTTVLEFDKPASVIMKHLTPCGVALSDNLLDAYRQAFECDKVSPYGGIFAFNRELDGRTAEEVSKLFAEIIIAPTFSSEAMEILSKKKNLRLITYDRNLSLPHAKLRSTVFGTLAQEQDNTIFEKLDIIGTTPVSEHDLAELSFAMTVVKHVKSNAIVLSKNFATIGVGAGQPNRVGAAKIAIAQAGDKCQGSYLASDAFLPFADSIEAAHQAGVKAVIEPGGSIRDQEVIDKANELGVGLVFTGQRHFLH